MVEFFLTGTPISVNKELAYKPMSFVDFLSFGPDNYELCISFVKNIVEEDFSNVINTLVLFSQNEDEFSSVLVLTLFDFIRLRLGVTKFEFNNTSEFIIVKNSFITSKMFKNILKIMLEEYYLIKGSSINSKFNPANEKAQEIARKLNDSNKKISKAKEAIGDAPPPLSDIIIRLMVDSGYTSEDFSKITAVACHLMFYKIPHKLMVSAAIGGANMKKLKISDIL